uniref:Uncharacterized protein n=1 Tax=Gracilaria salicornia TaxID=172968 RepID=W8DWE7_9FLOR|nr:hypothetical protein [Gracilaria salicornia]AHH24640.1 hypothetical protein [Gracilaria salicornia]UAD87587.1 hypothetical protein [Gracilaria salicornia]
MFDNYIFNMLTNYNYDICNSSNLYSSNFIKNLYVVSISIQVHISLYINSNKKYLKDKTSNFYWIFKRRCKLLLLYDIYWNLELNKKMYNCLIYECKNFLYSKDLLKRSRLNNHVQLKQIIQKLFSLFNIFFQYHNTLMSFKTVQKTYKLFSYILYSWYKKKYRKIVKLHNYWNNKLFINFIVSIRFSLLYIIFLEQINR